MQRTYIIHQLLSTVWLPYVNLTMTACDQISQATPLRTCKLQAIKSGGGNSLVVLQATWPPLHEYATKGQ